MNLNSKIEIKPTIGNNTKSFSTLFVGIIISTILTFNFPILLLLYAFTIMQFVLMIGKSFGFEQSQIMSTMNPFAQGMIVMFTICSGALFVWLTNRKSSKLRKGALLIFFFAIQILIMYYYQKEILPTADFGMF